MEKRLIVNVGRELGSGGRQMAKLIGQMLDLKFYDKELIHEASKASGICTDCFEKADEKPQRVWYSRFPFMGEPGFNGLSNDALFEIHYKTVRHLAENSNCIFVGRCTDYILRDNPACFNVFVHAPIDFRIKHLCQETKASEEEARQLIERTDKSRSSYYNFYTNKKWDALQNYDLTLDSSVFTPEQAVELIIKAAGYIGK